MENRLLELVLASVFMWVFPWKGEKELGLMNIHMPVPFRFRSGPLALGPVRWAWLHSFGSSVSRPPANEVFLGSHKTYFIWARSLFLSWVAVHQIPFIGLETMRSVFVLTFQGLLVPSFLWDFQNTGLCSLGCETCFHHKFLWSQISFSPGRSLQIWKWLIIWYGRMLADLCQISSHQQGLTWSP